MKIKPTGIGHKIWNIGFALFYPIISTFTAVFTLILRVFSWISEGLFLILNRFGKDNP